MDLIEMYPAAVNSKVTVTLGVLNADSTIIEVLDGSVLPDAPTLLVLGSDQTAETVKLTAKEGNTLTVERGIQGNAIAWPAGTQIARNFTAKDWDDLITNVATIVAKIMGLTAADVGAVSNMLEYFGNYTFHVLGGDHERIKNHIDSTVPSLPYISNYTHMYALDDANGKVKTCLSIPFDYTGNAYYYTAYDKKWHLIGDFKSDGSVPMSGSLKMIGDWLIYSLTNSAKDREAYFQLDPTGGLLLTERAYNDTNNSIALKLLGHDSTEDIRYRLKLVQIKDGKRVVDANIFGEHNYPAPMSNAGFHNSVYRGKYLGTSVTDAQWTAIGNGTFEDLYIGDYWTIGGINYRIAAFDYYYRTGDTSCDTHHVVLVPDVIMYTHAMNDTNITDGAYVGSKMYTEGLAQAKTTITNAFGSAHILNHRQLLCNATANGYETGHAWYDSTVELMTEQNVYGCKIFGNQTNGTGWAYNYTIDKSQYPLFTFRPDMISNRQWFWLRDVASAANFAAVNSNGNASANGASYADGVRPAFSIC